MESNGLWVLERCYIDIIRLMQTHASKENPLMWLVQGVSVYSNFTREKVTFKNRNTKGRKEELEKVTKLS